MLKPASFLDRDGVINVDKGYVHTIEDFNWILGSKDAIKYLNNNNHYVFVATNQSGIARGYYTENEMHNLHCFMDRELKKVGAYVDAYFYSPYHPDFSNEYSHLSHLRKPNTGMLEMAEKEWNFDKSKSFLIGDKSTDIECAKNYGIKGFLFDGGNLFEFVKKINI